MKHEKTRNCLVAFFLAVLLSWGAVGSMATGLHLEVSRMGLLFVICTLAALAGSLFFRFAYGDVALLCLLVPVTWVVFRREETVGEIFSLLRSAATLYDMAYGWGVPAFLSRGQLGADGLVPLGILGSLGALAISWTVCRRRSLTLGLLFVAVPFASCFVVTDTVPAAKYLFCFLLGLVLLVLTQSKRRSNAGQGVSLAILAAIPAALALGLLFWLNPQESYHHQPEALQEQIANWVQELPTLMEEASDDVAAYFSGSVQPSRVSLSSLGPRGERNYPVMDVTAPEDGLLYLRGRDYDVYDGSAWSASRHRTESLHSPNMTSVGNVEISTQRVRDVLYLPYYPGSGIALVGGALDNSDNSKSYAYAQWKLPGDWREQLALQSGSTALEFPLGSAQDAAPEQRYLVLPTSTKSWALALAGQITQGQTSATGKADAIGEYVGNSASYDRNTPKMTGSGDFVQWFLEESDTGYCVHFATAAAVLLRAAGVEARYVEGYLVPCQRGMEVTVTETMAHAWVEYYEPALDAWIVLEATPGDTTQPYQEEPTAPIQRPAQPREALPRETEAPTEETAGSTAPAEAPVEGSPPTKPGAGLWLVLPVLLLLALTEGQRQLRLALRRKRGRNGSPNDQALGRWEELALLHRCLGTAPPEEAEALARKAKYSQYRITREELAQLDRCAAQARKAYAALRWYKKLQNRYLFAI